MDTFFEEDPWQTEAVFTRLLLHREGKKAAFYLPDVFHTVSLGCGKAFSAGRLAFLQELCPGSSIPKRFEALTAEYLEFCKARAKFRACCSIVGYLLSLWLKRTSSKLKNLGFGHVERDIKHWAKVQKQPNVVQRITQALLGWSGSSEITGSWSKGSLTTSLCKFIEHFAWVRNLEMSCHEHLSLIAT